MSDLDMAAVRYAAAIAALREAKRDLQTEVRRATDAGMSESETARRAGVTRMTIRAWR